MALNKREQVLLVATLTLLVVGGNYLLVMWLFKPWGSLRKDLANQRRELAAIQATIQREADWRHEYDELRGSFAERSERFQQTSDVLKKIEEVGAASGILISARRPLTVVEKDVYRELPVQCTIESTVESLVKFLHALQTASGFMSVEQLQVSPRPDNPSILRCEVQIRALAGKMESAGT